MAGHAYPHIIFAKDDTVLSKESLGELVTSTLGRGTAAPGAISAVVDLDGYAVTFWFDDDAEGLAERYADFLPETARRRRLLACTTMIDASGDADPERAHAADLARVWDALAAREGVWVFSEAAKRFVGLDYGDGIPAAEQPVAEPAPSPVAVEEPVPVPEPAPSPGLVDEPVPLAQPPAPAQEPRPDAPAAAVPMPEVEPATPPAAPMPTIPPAADPVPMPIAEVEQPASPSDAAPTPEEEESEKPGLFKRLFGRGR